MSLDKKDYMFGDNILFFLKWQILEGIDKILWILNLVLSRELQIAQPQQWTTNPETFWSISDVGFMFVLINSDKAPAVLKIGFVIEIMVQRIQNFCKNIRNYF